MFGRWNSWTRRRRADRRAARVRECNSDHEALITHVRMIRAWIGSIDISINKAFTARMFDIASKDLAEMAQPEKPFFGIHISIHERVVIFAGGSKLRHGKKLLAPLVSAVAPASRIKPLRRLPWRRFERPRRWLPAGARRLVNEADEKLGQSPGLSVFAAAAAGVHSARAEPAITGKIASLNGPKPPRDPKCRQLTGTNKHALRTRTLGRVAGNLPTREDWP
jgi:hypothetical protein